MTRPSFHIQNIFDALNPQGTGVNGHLKLKCLQLENRVIGLANPGDIVVISNDCPPAFIKYMLRTTGVTNVLSLRHKVDRDLRRYLDAYSIFEGLVHNPQWKVVQQIQPVLSPYMQSDAVSQAARASGITVTEREWKVTVVDKITEKMNDKSVLYQECKELGIPIPRYWIAKTDEMIECVSDLLKSGYGPLYVRQARSGGALGNITLERVNSRYAIRELGAHALTQSEFLQVLGHFIKTSFSDEFVIAELLDLYASPGTLFFADDTGVTVVSHTYQVLNEERSFLGFVYPIQDKAIKRHFELIEKSVHLLVEPWRQQGYRGYGNVDWMIAKDGTCYIAERNARQTAVVPPLSIANKLSGTRNVRAKIVAPEFSIITRDVLNFDRPITFEDVHTELKKEGLLWEQSEQCEGVIITMPPLPRLGINSVGLMFIGSDPSEAYKIYIRALRALGTTEGKLLFEAKI